MTTEDKMTIDEQLKYLRRMKKRYTRYLTQRGPLNLCFPALAVL